MVLVLVNTTGGKSILKGLKENKIKTAVMLPSVYDAAVYGFDNAVVGSMENSRIRKIISENNITAVIDALDESKSEVSQNILEICVENKLPLLKFVTVKYDYSGFENVIVASGFSDAINYLSDNTLKVFVFGEIKDIKRLTDMADDRQKFFRLVLKGSEMNIDFAAASGIPLANLIAVDSVEDIEEISRIMQAYEIDKFLSFESPHSINAAELAKKVGTEIIIVKDENSGYFVRTKSEEEIVASAIEIEKSPNVDLEVSDKTNEDDKISENGLLEVESSDTLSAAFEDGREEYAVPKSIVVNKDGTVNMKKLVKYVKKNFD